MKNITIIFFFVLFSISLTLAQSGLNILDHDIDNPPNIFSKQPSQPASKVFREILNADSLINGQQVKIRSYAIPKIHSTMRVTCYYFLENGRWLCKMARFFSNYQGTPNGIGYLGPNTSGTATVLLNITSDGKNVNEFINHNGVVVTGNPPWASWLNPSKEWVFVTKLAEGEVNSPTVGIERAVAFMSGNSSPENNSESGRQKNDVNGFFGLFY